MSAKRRRCFLCRLACVLRHVISAVRVIRGNETSAASNTLVKYIKEIRLQKACELLETTNLNVQEIRVIIGTTDGTHFFRDFKEKFGSTPSEYRKNFTNSRNGG